MDDSRMTEVTRLVKHDCGACHGLTLNGGLGPSLRPENLKGKTTDYLITTILKGRQGTAMAPWGPFLSKDEAKWIVERLKKGEL